MYNRIQSCVLALTLPQRMLLVWSWLQNDMLIQINELSIFSRRSRRRVIAGAWKHFESVSFSPRSLDKQKRVDAHSTSL